MQRADRGYVMQFSARSLNVVPAFIEVSNKWKARMAKAHGPIPEFVPLRTMLFSMRHKRHPNFSSPKDHINTRILQTMVFWYRPDIEPWNQNVRSLCLHGLSGPLTCSQALPLLRSRAEQYEASWDKEVTKLGLQVPNIHQQLYVHIDAYTHITCIYIYTCYSCICLYIYTYTYTYTHVYVYIYIFTCIHLYIDICIHIHIYIYIYTHVYEACGF